MKIGDGLPLDICMADGRVVPKRCRPCEPNHFYNGDFFGRELSGQDLDVAAPGSSVVGPYQLQSGKTAYYYLGGTSMTSPHVAGTIALMAGRYPTLTALQAETILEAPAIPLPPGSRTVFTPYGYETFTWGADATGAGLANAGTALEAAP